MFALAAASRPVPCLAERPRPSSRRVLARRSLVARAEKQDALASVDEGTYQEYCSIGPDGKRIKLTLGEKEQLFLEALSSYYFDGKGTLSDAEFENLKEDLVWQGSKVAVLSSDEQRFLEAQLGYNRSKPIMSDADFDALKQELRKAGSVVTVAGPRCSLRSRKVISDASVDYLKMVLINIPAALLVLGGVFSIDDLTGFEITQFVELPGPIGIVFLWGFLLPCVYVLASSITNLVFKDALILKAPCPNCNTENTTYFGDILTVAGNRKTNSIVCGNPECKANLTFNADTREVQVTEAPSA